MQGRIHLRHCYDATEPGNIPAGSLAVVYVNTDGSYAWSQAEVNRMRAVVGISESSDPDFARYARFIAIEPNAGVPSAALNFLRVRREHHHSDGGCYVNLSNWKQVEQICLDANEDPEWFVAHPGDANPSALRSPIKHKQPVLVQTFWGQAYDMSVVLDPKFKFVPSHDFHATG